ncbi:MAG: thioredoxin-disulfide reductase [Deltaproteobacteria bacterium]|nr:thioredoxin-disulfide reductase [Deltaproteobacteria bacterium]
MRDVIIIGSGPAGYTAAIYAARSMLRPLVIEGLQPGGQLTTTTEVENFPGFPEGVQGPDLMNKMRDQAGKFGAEFVLGTVDRVNFKTRPLVVYVDGKPEQAKSVIIATGASAKYLGLESEQRLIGRGVSACATCDGFFFKGREIAVVGGGDSAMEEAIFLTRYASGVTLIHRRDQFRASRIMIDRARKNGKISFLLDTVVEEVLSGAEDQVSGLKIKNVKTGEIGELKIEGLFLAIGHTPNTAAFRGEVELDGEGYIALSKNTMTSIAGVFAAGDVVDKRYRQAITAAGMGCMAALDAEKYLLENP